MATNNALFLVFERNAFYKKMHYLVLAALTLNIIVICILLGLILHLIRNPPPPIYFATNEQGQLIDIVPLDQPNMTNDELLNWVTKAVEAAYSYDYLNNPSQLQAAQKYFTNYGWSEAMKSLTTSGNLVGVIKRKLIGIAKVVDKPKILKQGLIKGVMAWQIQMPVLVTYHEPPYNETSKFNVPVVVTLIVQRQPVLQSYQGLGIVQMIGAMPPQSTTPQELPAKPTG